MHFTFEKGTDCLRAELFGRQTVEETQEFIAALMAEVQESGCTAIVICVRNSRPIFRVDQYRIGEQLRRLAAQPEYRIALLADSDEVRASHEYIEVLARQQGANVRAFRDEAAARDWLGLSPTRSGRTAPSRS
jgi:hypothetical protein